MQTMMPLNLERFLSELIYCIHFLVTYLATVRISTIDFVIEIFYNNAKYGGSYYSMPYWVLGFDTYGRTNIFIFFYQNVCGLNFFIMNNHFYCCFIFILKS